MAKTQFVCSSCGYESAKWYGRCPNCQAWNSFSEVAAGASGPGGPPAWRGLDIATSSAPVEIGKIKSAGLTRLSTGFAEFDRVLGGGVVAGSAILLSGDPGIGKSTLLLQIAGNVTGGNVGKVGRQSKKGNGAGRKVLYVSGEESEGQIKIRAERIGISDKNNMLVMANGNIEQVIAAAEKSKPDFLIIDSIQTMSSDEFPGFAGSLPQLRHATSRIVSYAKKNSVPVFIIGHVTKEGEIAGPMLLSHMVDCVLYLEGESLTGTKILRSFKNRFGDTTEVGIFVMEEKGLVEVSDSSNFFMENSKKTVPGTCISIIMEGSRPLAVEIQALVVPSRLSFPRRVSNGISEKRVELLLAVIQKHLKVPIDRMDVFINVVGGLKITETGSDLAACLAILSSYKNKAMPGTIAIGEVGLLGEVKKVINDQSRIKEAKKLGAKKIISVENYKNLGDIIRNLW